MKINCEKDVGILVILDVLSNIILLIHINAEQEGKTLNVTSDIVASPAEFPLFSNLRKTITSWIKTTQKIYYRDD